MAISLHKQEQYAQNRLRMNRLNSRMNLYLWASVGLGAILFLSSFIAGMLSTLNKEQHGSSIFYYAMSAGVFQILMAVLTIVCGYITAAKKRVPSLILIGVYLIGMISIFMQKNGTFSAANMVFLIIGIALNIWAQLLLNENDMLKEEPGYPLFSEEADTPAHYEIPLDVRVRQAQAAAQRDMGTIGPAPAAAKSPAPAPMPAPVPVTRDENGFSDPKPLGPTPSVRLAQMDSGAEPPKPAEAFSFSAPEPPQAALESLAVQQPAQKETLPQVNAADMLADMTAIPSHATTQGNPDLLPSPEEVRARMAAMRRARQEHPQE